MTHFTQKTITREYHNEGQHLEQLTRYTFTGNMHKADHNKGADLNGYQIKTPHCTICQGTDLKKGIDEEDAIGYIFALKDGVNGFIMTKEEFYKFALEFMTITNESTKNGGARKIRLKDETKAMRKWFGY